jgi:hypothetical protein
MANTTDTDMAQALRELFVTWLARVLDGLHRAMPRLASARRTGE